MFSPPHLTVSVQCHKQTKKDQLLKIAAKANPLTEGIADRAFSAAAFPGAAVHRPA